MPKLKHSLVTKIDLHEITKTSGVFGKLFSSLLFFIFRLRALNKMYDISYDEDGEVFVSKALKYNNNKVKVLDQDLSLIPDTGPCIILFNHPFGALEALMLYKVLMQRRKDVKFVANFLLSRIKPISHCLVQVNPFETRKSLFSNISGIKEMYKVIEEGSVLCIFAAGEVSTKYKGSKFVEDKDWPLNIMKFIKSSNAPVISGYIDGENSKSFHFLGKINPLFRTARLPHELLNKKNLEVLIRFSMPMSSKFVKQIEDNKKLAQLLKARTYLLKQTSSLNLSENNMEYSAIIPELDNLLLISEIERIRASDLLFETDNYHVFFSEKQNIPNIFKELSRLREITFRKVGEGTGKEADFDKFDEYYKHLFIWDNASNVLVGAYRIGMGQDIIQNYGEKGFYLNTLYNFKEGFSEYLLKSMEMGRSFVVPEYQRKPLPLFLLWKGIYFVMQKHPEYKYLIGPVSISNIYSDNSKILIIEYLKRYQNWKEISNLVEPRFKFDYKKTHFHDAIFQCYGNDLTMLDRIVKDIDYNHYGVPTLVRKYLSLGGKILQFNVDPEFNYSIDGLVVLDIDVVSQEVISSYNK